VVDRDGCVSLYRSGDVLTAWKVESDLSGRLRLSHPKLLRNKGLCYEVERELVSLHGVDRFSIKSTTSSALIFYRDQVVTKADIVHFLDATLAAARETRFEEEGRRYELTLCTTALIAAACAQFTFPVLMLPSAVLFSVCGIPTFVGAWRVLTKERRLGVDVLDAIVILMCLASGQVFAGAVLTWCLGLGRKLLAKAREDSRRRLVNVFGKQPRTAFALINGVEVNVPIDTIQAGDTVVVRTGEMIPVDGLVIAGNAIVEQRALTGESAPVESTRAVESMLRRW
jgi:Cu2+-exporting ATPase